MDEPAKFRLLIETAERPEYDEVFERLARGELSKSEEMELRTAADPEIRRLYELFRPLDAAAKQRFDAALQQAFPARPTGWWASRSPAQRLALCGAPVLAAAAALLIFFFNPQEPETASQLVLASLEPLVNHTAQGTSYLGTSQPQGEEFQLLPDTCWHLQLGVAHTGRLPEPSSVHTYFAQADQAVAWDVTWRPQKNGSLAPTDLCQKIPKLATGRWELLVLSGRGVPNVKPQEAAALCRSGPPTGAGWRCDRRAVQILPLPNSP